MRNRNYKIFWAQQYKIYKETLKSGGDFNVALKENPYIIKFISGPTETQQLIAVKREPKVLKYIKGASHQVQDTALYFDPTTIKYVNNPSEEMWLLALKHTPSLIFKIPRPTWQMIEIVKDRISKINTHKGLTQDMKTYFTLVS